MGIYRFTLIYAHEMQELVHHSFAALKGEKFELFPILPH